jgi:hypothetical protein
MSYSKICFILAVFTGRRVSALAGRSKGDLQVVSANVSRVAKQLFVKLRINIYLLIPPPASVVPTNVSRRCSG